jgi:hypothetical protein
MIQKLSFLVIVTKKSRGSLLQTLLQVSIESFLISPINETIVIEI